MFLACMFKGQARWRDRLPRSSHRSRPHGRNRRGSPRRWLARDLDRRFNDW